MPKLDLQIAVRPKQAITPLESCKLGAAQTLDVRMTQEFVRSLDASMLLENGKVKQRKGVTEDDTSEFHLVNLAGKRLNNVDAISVCRALVLCNLSCNYLKEVNALRHCVNLVFLDLHSNQISAIPAADFWRDLSSLTTLYLHDNNIVHIEQLKHLSTCTRLTALTLYDTPLSLKRNYRHCAVNAVWTLKALDFCIVSDEEIIEDSHFPPRFQTLQPHMCFKPKIVFSKTKEVNPKLAMHGINKNLATINRLQAKYCPVLIIQRCIRGHLTRLRFAYLMDTRLWAAVMIQRFYRSAKGIPQPPPSSPNCQMICSLSSMKLDYETYFRTHRRPHHRSTMTVQTSNLKTRKSIKSAAVGDANHFHHAVVGQNGVATPRYANKRVTLEEQITYSNGLMLKEEENRKRFTKHNLKALSERLGFRIPAPNRYIREAKQKPGEVITGIVEDECLLKPCIEKPFGLVRDALEESVLHKAQDVEQIRRLVREANRIRKTDTTTVIEKKPVRKKPGKTRHFQLSCFAAVEKAYVDQDKVVEQDKRAFNVNLVRNKQQQHHNKAVQQKLLTRQTVVVENQFYHSNIAKALQQRRLQEEKSIKLDRERNQRCMEKANHSKANMRFSRLFASQNATIDRALADHDRQKLKVHRQTSVVGIVSRMRSELQGQKQMIDDYLHHAKAKRQADAANMRGDLNKLLKDRQEQREYETLERLERHFPVRILTPNLLPTKEVTLPIVS